MNFKLIYVKDLKFGDKFRTRGEETKAHLVSVVAAPEECLMECNACKGKTIKKLKVGVPGAIYHFDLDEVVEVLIPQPVDAMV